MWILLLLLIDPAWALPPGSLCALHSQCDTEFCLQQTCCRPLTNCAFCGPDGWCSQCERGFELVERECRQVFGPGLPCATNEDCPNCRTNCCARDWPYCTRCDLRGGCDACQDGYFLKLGACVPSLPAGSLCEYIFNQCQSGICQDRCCLKRGCTRCDEQGKCILKDVGEPCDLPQDCRSQNCVGGFKKRCCDPLCFRCNRWGFCRSKSPL